MARLAAVEASKPGTQGPLLARDPAHELAQFAIGLGLAVFVALQLPGSVGLWLMAVILLGAMAFNPTGFVNLAGWINGL